MCLMSHSGCLSSSTCSGHSGIRHTRSPSVASAAAATWSSNPSPSRQLFQRTVNTVRATVSVNALLIFLGFASVKLTFLIKYVSNFLKTDS